MFVARQPKLMYGKVNRHCKCVHFERIQHKIVYKPLRRKDIYFLCFGIKYKTEDRFSAVCVYLFCALDPNLLELHNLNL